TQHAGDVGDSGALAPALADRSGWLPFEVDHHEVVAGVEHLPEMEITVDADADAGQTLAPHRVEALEDLLLRGQYRTSLLLQRLLQGIHAAAQRLQDL